MVFHIKLKKYFTKMPNSNRIMDQVYLFTPSVRDRETAQLMANEIAKEFEEDVNLIFTTD